MNAPDFWAIKPLAPIQTLAVLRANVLKIGHRRLPKWRFRLASDLCVEIQPKPSERRDGFAMFACHALQGDDITARAFQCRRGLGLFSLSFGISELDGAWSIKPTTTSRPRWSSREQAAEFRRRVDREMGAGRFDHLQPDMMLSPACLMCGRPLTDPASMARWIGPECFGSATLAVPRTLVLGSAP